MVLWELLIAPEPSNIVLLRDLAAKTQQDSVFTVASKASHTQEVRHKYWVPFPPLPTQTGEVVKARIFL